MNDEPNCWTCAYSDLPETVEPCASCDMYFSHFESTESTESTDTAASEDARRCSLSANSVIPCWCNPLARSVLSLPDFPCKYGDLPGTVEPCASCFDEGLDHPLNYEEATESEDEGTVGSGDEGTVGSGIKGIVPQHIVDMFTERVKQAALRFVNECNAHPRPCPYCGEIPEVVEETIYPGEEHCYVVCNGAKLLPHSISIHGRTREEAVAHWNSFAIDIISQRK